MEMSFLKALCFLFLTAVVFAFVMRLLFLGTSGNEDASETAFGSACIFFILAMLVGLFKLFSSKCPKCKKYFCYGEYKHEDLSRDVVSKKVKDNELGGTKLEHYAVGKRKYYYKCNKCGYESTSIKDYKDKIDV